MTTPTTQPAQAGREKCAAPEWCGMKEIGHDPRDKAYFSDERDNIGVVIDGHIYCSLDCPSRLPPIAPPTPAPARERRAGQRWRSGHTPPIEFVLAERLVDTNLGYLHGPMETWLSTDGRRWYFGEIELRALTLLSDAPATSEPGRACGVCDEKTEEPYHCGEPVDEAARPAQEATKASVCVGLDGHVCSGPVLQRAVGAHRGFMCEKWMLRIESRVTDLTRFGYRTTDILRDPKIPERLPRPRLMHSAMWADEASDV